MTPEQVTEKFHRLVAEMNRPSAANEAAVAGIMLDVLLDFVLDHKRIADAIEDLAENGITTYHVS